MRVLQQIVTDPHPCHYLGDREAITEYSYAPFLEPEEYEELMNQGYRKFGPLFFRPVCLGCQECRPIRIPVDRFQPDRSQRRCWKRNQDLEIRLASPTVDSARLDLFQKYHDAQIDRKGWEGHGKDADEYAFSFVHNPIPAVEVTMWEGDALRAVLLTEVTPTVVSGIYHYWDPEHAHRGLGTYCMLHTLDLARRLQKQWAYFGFYVTGCGSLEYKARFQPCELMDPSGVWRPWAQRSETP